MDKVQMVKDAVAKNGSWEGKLNENQRYRLSNYGLYALLQNKGEYAVRSWDETLKEITK